jgi:exoribonuclease R
MPWEGHEDIEIKTDNLGGALNGDEVEVELQKLFPRPQGIVKRVVSRAKTEFVVTLKQNNGVWVGVPADQKVYRPIRITNASDAQANTASR